MVKIYLENLEFAWTFMSTSCYPPFKESETENLKNMRVCQSHSIFKLTLQPCQIKTTVINIATQSIQVRVGIKKIHPKKLRITCPPPKKKVFRAFGLFGLFWVLFILKFYQLDKI